MNPVPSPGTPSEVSGPPVPVCSAKGCRLAAVWVLAWNNPRVFLDWSVLASLFTTRLAGWLTEWLELLPASKLLFGTDASSPELYYTAAVNGRRQLGAALDQLVTCGTLSRGAAMALAERVCFKNAVDLYGLGDV